MNKEKKEEGSGLGKIITMSVVLVLLLVGLSVYTVATGPYRMADDLRERLDENSNASDDYKQGWLDCVEHYLHLAIGPTNMTASNTQT